MEDEEFFFHYIMYFFQARSPESSGLVSVLLEGSPNAGKTALAAQLAKNSDFPFIKVCSPEDMVGFSESAKCLQIRKVRMIMMVMCGLSSGCVFVFATPCLRSKAFLAFSCVYS